MKKMEHEDAIHQGELTHREIAIAITSSPRDKGSGPLKPSPNLPPA
jgi:hypothetical protein